eukprot:11697040-Karenia_brevis.AAC.1
MALTDCMYCTLGRSLQLRSRRTCDAFRLLLCTFGSARLTSLTIILLLRCNHDISFTTVLAVPGLDKLRKEPKMVWNMLRTRNEQAVCDCAQ